MNSTTQLEREKPLEIAVDPRLSRGVKAFLKVLNSSGGPPLETLPPLAAREVLVNAQASVPVDLSGIEESEKTITVDGYPIKLNIVRPEGVKGKLPVFIFIHGGGWVLGDYPTHKRMVRDLVRLFGAYYPRKLPADQVIRQAGLEEKADSRAGDLSGGQHQRLYYALAICGDPEVLFLDEPTVAMDVEGRRAFLSSLRQWASAGRTIVLTTHYLEEADQLAERIVVIDRGRIIADAPPAEIKSRVAGKKIAVRFRVEAPRDLLETLPVSGLTVSGDYATMLSAEPVAAVRRIFAECGDEVLDLEVAGADLEEAFVHLTAGEP